MTMLYVRPITHVCLLFKLNEIQGRDPTVFILTQILSHS